MRVYTVQARPPSHRKGPATLLLRDGFAWGALLAPTIWFLANRLVALAAIHAAACIALAILLPAPVATPLLLGLNLFIGFEARNLQAWWLGLRGWRTEGVVMGRDEEAAFLHLATWRPDLAQVAR
jgi:hypothetical protein